MVLKKKNERLSQAPMAQTCNYSYSGDPILKKTLHKKELLEWFKV
jgi:hypothetical protein